ncbi:MAG: hypothetical protein AVDCRST_MAG95-117 [uncultured Adhaeribacter sp.]|uniref:PKD domain-containing protein n=1 Tax=uncultured Adhaeribacter sp. TaxID=448109 RepID=A0A6J4GZK2_9BACT|nr:MAG: hypothetical protein AVDCRST_MAG95-117 [uncultured Adhaeribacter sp.]
MLPKYLCLFFLLYLLTLTAASAQTPACPEKFRAYNRLGQQVTSFCVGEPIRFKSCDPAAQPDKEYYDTNKSNGLAFPDTVKSVVYSVPGTYTVTQLINTGLPGNNQFEQTFTVLDTPPPTITGYACAFYKVSFRITDTHYDYYRVNFGDGTERRVLPGKDTTYQYQRAVIKFELKVKGYYRNAACVTESNLGIPALIEDELANPQLKSISIQNYSEKQGKLEIKAANLNPYYRYILQRAPLNSTAFQEIKRLKSPVDGQHSITLDQTDTHTVYHYRLQVTDSCGTNINVFSNILYTQPLALTTQNKTIRLTWQSYPTAAEVSNYQVYRDNQLLQTLPASATSLTDAALACGKQYCYRLVVVLKNNSSSFSNDTCQQVNATVLPQPGFLLASYNAQNQVELRLQPGANETLEEASWQKTVNNGAVIDLGSAKSATFLDAATFNETEAPCYRATYTDSCGLTSAVSLAACPVILKGNLLEKEGVVALNWSEYIGFAGTPQYTLEVLDATTQQLLNSYSLNNRSYRDGQLSNTSQILAYRIKVSSPAGVSYSNQVRIAQAFSAAIPSAFSPNNDGLNDIFAVQGRFINAVLIKIYTRSGQIIFESKQPNQGWDGRVNGRPAPVGTYIYSLTAQDLNGQTISRTGSVTLVK